MSQLVSSRRQQISFEQLLHTSPVVKKENNTVNPANRAISTVNPAEIRSRKRQEDFITLVAVKRKDTTFNLGGILSRKHEGDEVS